MSDIYALMGGVILDVGWDIMGDILGGVGGLTY
jgi:hypothetical protein